MRRLYCVDQTLTYTFNVKRELTEQLDRLVTIVSPWMYNRNNDTHYHLAYSEV